MRRGRPLEYAKRVTYTSSAEGELYEKFRDTLFREGKPMNEILQDAMKDYVKEHSESQNPQTKITLFENKLINAIPNIYAKPQAWHKFYYLIKKKEEYKVIDEQLNMILGIHNQQLRKIK